MRSREEIGAIRMFAAARVDRHDHDTTVLLLCDEVLMLMDDVDRLRGQAAPLPESRGSTCEYIVDHDHNVCGDEPTTLFRWGDHYEWRCERHDPIVAWGSAARAIVKIATLPESPERVALRRLVEELDACIVSDRYEDGGASVRMYNAALEAARALIGEGSGE